MEASSFNKGWLFYKDGNSCAKKEVTLPHDAMIYEDRSKENPSGAGCAYFTGGRYFYEKTFFAPEEWKYKSVIVEFEGVYQKAVVALNDVEVCTNAYGYSNFFIVLDEALKYGENNTLLVTADNTNCPNSRWYSGSGIYRNVKIYVGEKKHIIPDSVFISASEDGTAIVSGKVTGGEKVKLSVFYDGNCVSTYFADVNGDRFRTTFQVESPKLWDDASPNLYELQTILLSGEKEVDRQSQFFGFRTIKWDAVRGLTVNGKTVLLRGSCVHHDNGIMGAAAIDEAEVRKVRLHKEAGFNAIRSSHNPCSKTMLEACDRYGIYVMDEFADQWLIHKNPHDYADADFKANWKRDLEAMIRKDYSHPSVIMYSIGNEISELGLKAGADMAKEMTRYVKGIDSTRPVTAGTNLMLAAMAAKGNGLYGNDDSKKNAGNQSMDDAPTSTFFNVLMNHLGDIMDKMASNKSADKVTDLTDGVFDISGYNYATSRYVSDGKKYPGRVIVGSETLPRSAYRNWKLVEKLPYLVGDFVWTGWDYLGESGLATVKYKSEKDNGRLTITGGSGLIDICGKMRPEMQWNRMIWHMTDTPEISVEPMNHAGDTGSVSMWRDTDGVSSWSWPGCEGKKNKVRIYATGAYVELLVNDKSYGKKKTKEYKAEFKNVCYEPGRIIARSFSEEGRLIGEKMLLTETGDTRLKLTASKDELFGNGEDICYVDIELVGNTGKCKSSCDVPVTVQVEGAGELIALGSSRPMPIESFVGNTHTTYLGKAQAVIRAKEISGETIVTVKAKGMTDTTLKINCRAI